MQKKVSAQSEEKEFWRLAIDVLSDTGHIKMWIYWIAKELKGEQNMLKVGEYIYINIYIHFFKSKTIDCNYFSANKYYQVILIISSTTNV